MIGMREVRGLVVVGSWQIRSYILHGSLAATSNYQPSLVIEKRDVRSAPCMLCTLR